MNRRRLLQYGAFGLALPGIGGAAARPASQAGDDDRIVRAAIHPAIGIARVGNSPDGWFLGPEAPGPHPVPPGGFKDDQCRVKRQAARFFFRHELPRTAAQFDLLDSLDRTTLEMRDDWF